MDGSPFELDRRDSFFGLRAQARAVEPQATNGNPVDRSPFELNRRGNLVQSSPRADEPDARGWFSASGPR